MTRGEPVMSELDSADYLTQILTLIEDDTCRMRSARLRRKFFF